MEQVPKIPRSQLIDKDNKLTLIGVFFLLSVIVPLLDKGYLPTPQYIRQFIDFDK